MYTVWSLRRAVWNNNSHVEYYRALKCFMYNISRNIYYIIKFIVRGKIKHGDQCYCCEGEFCNKDVHRIGSSVCSMNECMCNIYCLVMWVARGTRFFCTAGNVLKFVYRWKNWWIRGVFAFVMIGIFVVIIVMGPLSLTMLVSCWVESQQC